MYSWARLDMYVSVYVCVCMCCPTTISISMLLYSKGYVCMKWHHCVLEVVEVVVCDASCRSTYSRVLLANVIQSFSSNS